MVRSLMRVVLRTTAREISVLTLSAFVACGQAASDPTSLSRTLEFGTYGAARIEGIVLSKSASPLDSVVVAVRVLGPSSDFSTLSSTTGADGRFRVELRRIKAATGAYVQADTQTVLVYGAALKLKYRGNDGSLPSDSVRVTIRVAPEGATTAATSVELHMPVP